MTAATRSRVARAVASGALVLAVTSRGELGVLALLLLLLDLRVASVLALTGAVVASSWRWGTTSMEALAGAQSVLGPAGGVGPAWAATGSWLAGSAIVLAVARGSDPVRHVAVGTAVAAVLAGPGPGGELPVRVAVAVGVAAGSFAVARWRSGSEARDRLASGASALAALGAVGAVALADGSGPATVEVELVVEGLAVAVAAAGPVLVLGWLLPRPRWSAGDPPPTVERLRAASAALPTPP